MEAFIQPLREMAEYEDLLASMDGEPGVVQVTGCIDSQKAHLIYGLSQKHRQNLIIAADEQKARELWEDYRFYDRDVLLYPGKDLLFYRTDIQGNLLLRQRMQVIQALLTRQSLTIVTSIDGCMDHLKPLEDIQQSLLHFSNDASLDLEQLRKQLVSMGYEYTAQVEMSGQFSVRGGIIDIYPLTEENPWRIELWGDEIDSIRSFDPESQRSLENLREITIYPAQETEGTPGSASFLDYFSPEESLLYLDEPNRLADEAAQIEKEFRESMLNRAKKGETPLNEGQLCDYQTFCKIINTRHCISLCTIEQRQRAWKTTASFDLTVQSVGTYHNSFDLLVHDLTAWKQQKYRVILLSGSHTRASRLAEDLRERGLHAFYTEDYDRVVKPGEIMVVYGHAHKGFSYPLLKFIVISDSDIFGKAVKKRASRKKYAGQRIQDFAELTVGDYVVHEKHGLGIYRGVEKITVDKVVKDYIKIEYSGGSNLYILATQLDALQKYADAASKAPRLNRLGGGEWNKTRNRVRGAVREIAQDLVELYAVRQDGEGYAFGKDTIWQKEFEELFPFEETEDQLQAIEDTKRDMESTKIMDRLICGDVGYGKTEIAIRAAFKAVQESKQVAFLVPTTILAQQHYNTFVQRMKDFPVRVDLLCRFRSSAEQKETIRALQKGEVDIVIGTHRLLSSDVLFKDLGLLVIDEEQRFGVTHKEKIKKLKQNVDVLTLTATPIPRTLHMSLIGIRDMSVLEEAPLDRVPIQTYVMEYDEETVREAIKRELARDGQIYYVYNRVNDIADVTSRIAGLVPEARVAYAHGQMPERDLEQIMIDFINRDIDVLVSTTIIETGLDISNVNTMIVHDADRYGLSQLYQLRGRIGRSNRTAYAFLMYRRDRMLQETAEKRLSAIREYAQLGSGMRIAMRDLEIRGAGNLLGAEQHGHLEAVGYNLYCKMLSEAVEEARGIQQQTDYETTIDLDMDAYIPAGYIASEYQKLDIYKRIAGIESMEDYDDMMEELLDRFGKPPACVMNLLLIAQIKAQAHHAYITEIKQDGDMVKIVMYEKSEIDPNGIPQLLQEYGRSLTFKIADPPYFLFHMDKKNPEALRFLIEKIGQLGEKEMAKV